MEKQKVLKPLQLVHHRKLILIMVMVLLLVLTGCKGSSKTITDKDVRKGFDGLATEFVKNAPPDKVFEETLFPIAIKLNNKGASNIKNGFLALGFETAYVDFANELSGPRHFEIEGKSIFDLNGDEKFITLNGETKKIGVQSETHPSTILATACYQYQSILGTSVCVDTDIFGTGLREKSCQVKELTFSQGQGGPVAITKIETRMLPLQDEVIETEDGIRQEPNKVRPHFIVHVENKGNGEVINLKKIEAACTKSTLDFDDFNRLTIKAFLSNEQELNCNIGDKTGDAEVRLREKKDVIRCTLEEGINRVQDAYTTPLRIEMDYGYTFTISKDITIEKILTY